MAERLPSPPDTMAQIIGWAQRFSAETQRALDRIDREKHSHPYSGKVFERRTVAAIIGTGTDQATASELPADFNTIAIATTGTGAGRLQNARAGREMKVFNIGTAAISIYPVSGERIGTLSTNTALSLGTSTAAHFSCVADGTWQPALYRGS